MSKKATITGIILAGILLYFFSDTVFGFLDSPSFEISVHPESIILNTHSGSTNSTKIFIASINGYDSNVSIDVHITSVIIVGDLQLIHPSQVALEANQQVSFELTFRVVSIMPGTYYADIIASDGQLERSERIAITVPT